jgi:RimJ/RimL family protein N-acetyltransferase
MGASEQRGRGIRAGKPCEKKIGLWISSVIGARGSRKFHGDCVAFRAVVAPREPRRPYCRHNRNRKYADHTGLCEFGDAAVSFPDELLTDRLRLRPPAEADAELMYARYSADAEVVRYLSWAPHQSVADTREYLRQRVQDNADGSQVGYLIFSRETNELLGAVGGKVQSTLIQFGYCLARSAWGRGVATEAASAFVVAAMAQPTIWRVQALCDLENLASAHVLEKCGLKLEGTLRRYMVLPNLGTAPRDVLCYAIVRDRT